MQNLDELIQKMETKLCKPEDMLLSRGQDSHHIFFLSKGIIEIFIDDPRYGKIEDEYFELEQGSIFGEIGVLLKTRRSAYCRAQDYSILEMLSLKNFDIICKNNQIFKKFLRHKMQNYQDRRTLFVKQMLRDLFFGHLIPEMTNSDREMTIDEEVITDMCYSMIEFYFPQGDLIFNKGDSIDGILFIIEGQVNVNLKSSASQQFLLERLGKKCTYGFHTCLSIFKDETKPLPQCEHRLVSSGDTIILKLPFDYLKTIRKKSKLLSKIIDYNMKFLPACDFTFNYALKNKLRQAHCRTRLKRAVRRQIQINRDKVFRAKLFNFSMMKDNMFDRNEKNFEFFEEDTHIKQIELSQRAQRNLESKLF